MKRVPVPFKFYQPMIDNLKTRGYNVKHTLFLGGSGRGKFYLASWMMEQGVGRGLIKAWGVWCRDWSHLQEYLTFLFPNTQGRRDQFKNPKFLPRKFRMKVFIPISENMPKFINNSLVLPFTMSIDKLSQNVFTMLCGSPKYYQEYDNLIGEDVITPTEFRKRLDKSKFSGYDVISGFNKVKMTHIRGANTQVMNYLARRLGDFNREGILASSSYQFALEKMMRHTINNQDEICVLYVGNIRNPIIKKILMVYFVETLQKLCAEQKNKNPDIKFKHVVHFNEFESIVGMGQSKELISADNFIINQCMLEWASEMRHFNMEMWGDSKGLMYMDVKVRNLFKDIFFFGGINDINEIEKMCRGKGGFSSDTLLDLSTEWENDKIYRFIKLNEKSLPRWKSKGKDQIGYKLNRERLCMDGKAYCLIDDMRKMAGDDWTKNKRGDKILNWRDTCEYLGGEIYASQQFKKDLGDIYKKDEDKWREERQKRKKERIEEKKKGKDYDKKIRQQIIPKLIEKGIKKQSEIAKILGASEKTINRDFGELRELGLIDPNDI